jgi:hypothetical protein
LVSLSTLSWRKSDHPGRIYLRPFSSYFIVRLDRELMQAFAANG